MFKNNWLVASFGDAVRPTFLLSAILGICSTGAQASIDPPTGPSNSANGNYTINYPWNEGDTGCEWVELQERADSSTSWTYIADTDKDGAVTFTSQPIGTYQYRSYTICEDYYAEYSWAEWSSSISVSVGVPPDIDSIENQLLYEYEARTGDINSDALLDIFVSRTSGGESGNGVVDKVLMQQNTNGTFTAFAPNSTQITQAGYWNAASIDIAVIDVNSDGFVDLTMQNLTDAINGKPDQIVYSPAEVMQLAPKANIALTQDLKNFASDIVDWYQNDNYFYEHEEEHYEPGYWVEEEECWWEYEPYQGWELYCEDQSFYVEEREWTTYPGVTDEAVEFWEGIVAARNGQGTLQDIVDILTGIFRVQIGIPDDCVDQPQLVDNYCVHVSLDSALLALAFVAGDPDSAAGREADQIYVTGHKIEEIWGDPTHMALEYRGPGEKIGFAVTISARAETNGEPVYGDGALLVSKVNLASDRPHRNFKIATVSRSNWSQSALFAAMEVRRQKYRDCLPYQPAPGAMLGTGWNSNGFVTGLLDVVFADASVDISGYVGADHPVPFNEFFDTAKPCSHWTQ